MKKNCFYLTFISIFLIVGVACENKKNQVSSWNVSSPDSTLNFSIFQKESGLYYTVLSGQDTIIRTSQLGISRLDQQFVEGLTFVSAEPTKTIEEAYTMSIGKRIVNKNIGNEGVFLFKNKADAKIQIAVRAFNDGVAFKYIFPEGSDSVTVFSESSAFAIPTNGKTWLQSYGQPSEWGPAYENGYSNGTPVGEASADTFGFSFPALFQTNNHWIMLTESGLDEKYFASHLSSDCKGGVYKIRLPESGEALGKYPIYAKSQLPFSTPWRTIIIGKSLASIVESNLVHDLAEPNKIGDFSWVKPGRSSWNWWGEHDGSKKYNSLKNFVDLSRELGWEYSLVDANWDLMEDGGKIEDLVKYAQCKQIGLSLWYNSGGEHNKVTERPREIMSDPVKRKQEFKKLKEWGVKAVKIDFFQSDKQEIVKLYLDILKDAAAEQIMVVFHGCTLPRGWSRTYPNLVSMEAIRGAEQYGWDSAFARIAPTHNTIVPFTRNVVGPMDYTPVTFSGYPQAPHITTYAHELALAVLFESGILHFADRAPEYRSLSKDVKEYLKVVPVAWDNTKLLDGEPGKLAIIARQKGEEWFIAGANGENKMKSINLDLSFLPKGEKYKIMVLRDGKKSNEIATSILDYTAGEAFSVEVLPFGGFSLWIKR